MPLLRFYIASGLPQFVRTEQKQPICSKIKLYGLFIGIKAAAFDPGGGQHTLGRAVLRGTVVLIVQIHYLAYSALYYGLCALVAGKERHIYSRPASGLPRRSISR